MVDVSDQKRVRECRIAETDWATIGRRIVRAAAMATAVHVTEYEKVHVTEPEEGSGCSPPLKRRATHLRWATHRSRTGKNVGVPGPASGEAGT